MKLTPALLLYFGFLISLITADSFINLADVDCGISENVSQRIVGGSDAKNGEFPWMVSIKYLDDKNRLTHACGGSLINKRWVLSAAQCFPSDGASSTEKLSKIVLSVGEYGLEDERNRALPKDQMFKAQKILLHPSFVSVDAGRDMALIYLDREVNWSQFVKPVCLANDPSSSFADQTATVVGWGTQDEDTAAEDTQKLKATVLQKVDIPIISNSKCQEWYEKEPRWSVTINDDSMCAGLEEGGKDTCRGDSGGPLMVKHSTGRYVLAGITSWGIGCARPSLPGMYTRAANHVDWIMATVASTFYSEQLKFFYSSHPSYFPLVPKLIFKYY